MSYIGASPTTAAFVTDTFSANGSGTVFTLSVAPANTNSILVAVSGVLQDPSTYSVSGTSLTFSAAPPAGTGNISVRFLGIPASGVVNTAYRTQTEFTATAGQTTFSVPSYTVGFIDVYRNGALLGSADFTATNGTTVVLTNAASSGDLVETVSFFVSSVVNAIPAVAGAVTNSYLLDGAVTAAKMGANGTWAPAGSVIQVVSANNTLNVTSLTSTSYITLGLTASITPKFSSSTIYVMATFSGTQDNGSNDQSYISIYRNNTTNLKSADCLAMYDHAGGNVGFSFPISFYDSPATTSATSYTIYAKVSNSGSQFRPIANTDTIVLMEIAA
jgi:hypothetical protein